VSNWTRLITGLTGGGLGELHGAHPLHCWVSLHTIYGLKFDLDFYLPLGKWNLERVNDPVNRVKTTNLSGTEKINSDRIGCIVGLRPTGEGTQFGWVVCNRK